MLLPRMINKSLFDDFFTDSMFNSNTTNVMSTDIREKDNGYLLDMEVPGFNKEDLKLELKDGYLTVSAEHKTTNDEKDNDGHIIRQERYYGSSKRSFYVGDQIEIQDIQAKYDKGILSIFVPKKEVKQIENNQTIEIL